MSRTIGFGFTNSSNFSKIAIRYLLLATMLDSLINPKRIPGRRRFNKWLITLSGLLFTAPLSSTVEAGIFKYVDENGVVHYTNVSPEDQNYEESEELGSSDVDTSDPLVDDSNRGFKNSHSEDKINTLLHEGIGLQAKLHDVSSDIKKLDTIIKTASGRISTKAQTKAEAEGLMGTINELIHDFDFNFKNRILRKKNCMESYIYHAVGEALLLPIFLVSAPGHVFARYELSGEHLNWESTSDLVIDDSDYISRLNISPVSITNGVHLKSRSRQEVWGRMHTIAGNDYYDRGDFDTALSLYTKAINLSPNDIISYHQRSRVWTMKKQFERAVRDLTTAIKLDPHYSKAWVARGISYLNSSRNRKAKEDFEAALNIEWDNPNALKYLEMAERRMKNQVDTLK